MTTAPPDGAESPAAAPEPKIIPLDALFGPDLDLDLDGAPDGDAPSKPKRGLFRRKKKS